MTGEGRRVVRVLPDVAAIDKEFDYLVPTGVAVSVGDVVRVDLHGRRVGGWVVAADVESEPGITLRPLAKVSGRGPSPDVIELADWAAWRWAGRRASYLRTASPPAVVAALPPASPSRSAPDLASLLADAAPDTARVIRHALELDRALLRLAPGADRYILVRAALADAATRGGSCLVLCPSVDEARGLGRRLIRDGVDTAVVVDGDRPRVVATEWARAAAGATAVVGTRSTAWAPVANLTRVVVLDEHDEAYQQEQAPTWHARDVVLERARRADVPVVLVSPCPSLEALGRATLVKTDRQSERLGWGRVEVVDQRDLDPSLGPLFSPRLVDLVRGPGRVLCVLNRTGRSRLLACATCSTLARCERCSGPVADLGGGSMVCGRCGTERPPVCLDCGGARFKNLRLGVSRAREELEALVGEPVGEVTAGSPEIGRDDQRVVMGTEAVLHRVDRADVVAFLDFDQELLAPRYRAVEQALALLARACRLVHRSGRSDARVLVQTRSPDHPVLVAARLADPGRLSDSEAVLRSALGFPPAVAMAVVSGMAAEAWIAAFGAPSGVAVQGPVEGAWRLTAPDHETLCDAMSTVTRPPGRLRLEVDPLRL